MRRIVPKQFKASLRSKQHERWLKQGGMVVMLLLSGVCSIIGFSSMAHAAAAGCEQHPVTQGTHRYYQCTVEVGAGACLWERNVTTFATEACVRGGTTVYVARQVRLKNHAVNGSTIWDILNNGWMVSDDYVNTGRYNAFSLPIKAPPTTVTATTTATHTPVATPTAKVSATPAATETPSVSPTATTGTTGLEPVGQSGSWKLLFHDEFDGSSLDTGKWTTCYENFHLGQDCDHDQSELELYQPSGVSEGNGALTLEAQKQDVTASNGQVFHYTSGMISSGPSCDGCAPHFAFTYGYMEMRAKVPAGQGMWPAFWTLPVDGSWPPEVDAFEILGNAPNEINMTYHWPDGSGEGGQKGQAWDGPDFSAGWHTFAVDWEPGSVTWYVDGVQRFQYVNANVASKAMYLIANLAVGGDWPSSPNASTPFPAKYQIDYIRVWQR